MRSGVDLGAVSSLVPVHARVRTVTGPQLPSRQLLCHASARAVRGDVQSEKRSTSGGK